MKATEYAAALGLRKVNKLDLENFDIFTNSATTIFSRCHENGSGAILYPYNNGTYLCVWGKDEYPGQGIDTRLCNYKGEPIDLVWEGNNPQ